MPDEPEYLTTGPEPRPRRARFLLLGGVVLLLVAVLVAQIRSTGSEGTPPPSPSPTPVSPSPATETPAPPRPVATPTGTRPVTTRGGGPLTDGVPAGTLYARGGSRVYALDPSTGTVVSTSGVTVDEDGAPISFVPTAGGVIVQTAGSAGHLIPDGQRMSALAQSVQFADLLVPAPNGQIWAVSNPDRPTATRYDPSGVPIGAPVSADSGSLGADGNGGLLLYDVSGVWQAEPGPVRQLTSGQVLAVGPSTYEVYECDADHRCTTYTVNRQDGTRRAVATGRPTLGLTGLTAPDGRWATQLSYEGNGAVVSVVSLEDGAVQHRFAVATDAYGVVEQSAAWLDSRWLALIDGGRLLLYDPAADRVVRAPLDLRGLTQLAWRSR